MTPASNLSQPRLDLVLIGGGHAHLGVLRSLMMRPEPGIRLTLVAKELEAPYSGMLPGFVSGRYTQAEAHVDLLPLATAAGARLVIGEAIGLDLDERRVLLAGRESLRFDLLSLNIGVTPQLGGIDGARTHGVPVKPVSAFARRWQALRRAAAQPDGPRRIAVIGGGAAGFELALAANRRLRAEARAEDPRAFDIALIAGGALLNGFAPGARKAAREALREAQVSLIENDPAVELTEASLRLASGATVPTDAALIAAEAAAPSWLRETGLALDAKGYVCVEPTLESGSHRGVFAVGDCASVKGHPRPKAGVFAVRQGPPLAENLRRAARGETLAPYHPQRRFLSLLSTGDGRAIASRGKWSARGAWVWRWKDWIDRRFVDKHRPPPMSEDEEMRCGGCAAKIGPATLAAALARLGDRPPTEDAAIIESADDGVRVESVDYFRAFWSEPFLFGRIAANHALGDLYAMGARPESAQAIATLPQLPPKLAEEDLFQMIAGARSLFKREDVALLGGHSSEGAEMALGFSVSGRAERRALWRKSGLRPGDKLILTRPIGSGVLFAAAMRGLASGAAVRDALSAMQRSHAPVVDLLRSYEVSAATDVTGFGLAGHLLEMLNASERDAEIDFSATPLYPQARALAEAGVASTLLAENLAFAGQVETRSGASPSAAILALLFDPQTAGPLLFGVPAPEETRCIRALNDAGAPDARVVGKVTDRKGGTARLRID